MVKTAKPKAIVIDVAGPVAKKAFMSNSEESKNFMKKNIVKYSTECLNQKDFRLAVDFAKYKKVPGKKQPPPIADQFQPPNVQLESIVQHFLWRLQNEGVSEPVALFHLYMMFWGYERGLLVTPVYEEVAATLEKWCVKDKIKIHVLTGSEKLLNRVFSNTSVGNLLNYIEGRTNLMVDGGYRKNFTLLANLLKQKEEDILFITGLPEDARLAKAAKINSIIIYREDYGPQGVELLQNKDKPGVTEPKAEAAAPSLSADMTAESKVTSQDIRDFQVVTRLDDIH
ncbi:enolase-phosphatase E-1-like protein 3, partial [Leptotrombidium deliense]